MASVEKLYATQKVLLNPVKKATYLKLTPPVLLSALRFEHESDSWLCSLGAEGGELPGEPAGCWWSA